MKRINLFLILTLALLIFLTSLSFIRPVYGEETLPEKRTIYIKNAEDLRKLSRDSSYDRFSKNLLVLLEADIDLEEDNFDPIPIFCGTFDGQGHRIRGLSIDAEGASQGFIRFLKEGAVLKNLDVFGYVTPLSERISVGGLVGENQGTIENCSFSGYVKGDDQVGGLVGFNGDKGLIKDSSSGGTAYGKRKVGGIAGHNAGKISGAKNDMRVNTTVEEEEFDFEGIDLDDFDIGQLTKLLGDITDLGGIAGVNTGHIKDSENLTFIGYNQVGYNVGGIAGRQNGYIENCINSGTIKGRKEVGGIVGQMEPHINIFIPPSELNKIDRELDKLRSSIDSMMKDTKYIMSESGKAMAELEKDIDSSKTHVGKLVDMTEDLIDEGVAMGKDFADDLKPLVDGFEDILEGIDPLTASLEDAFKIFRELSDDFPDNTEEIENVLEALEDAIEMAREAGELLESASEDVTKALEILAEGQVEDVLPLLRSAIDKLDRAVGGLFEGLDGYEDIEASIREIIDSLEDEELRADLEGALEELSKAMDIMRDLSDKFSKLSKDIDRLKDKASSFDDVDLDKIDADYQRAGEDLLDSLGGMSATLSGLMTTLFSQGEIIADDIEIMGDQMTSMMDMTFDLIDGIINAKPSRDDFYQDVSREDVDKWTDGKVYNSLNLGDVDGDINVGGVTGAMAIEFKADPEDDLGLMEDITVTAVLQTSAIIQDCENRGFISAKKDGAGGIAGITELGFILDVKSEGEVRSLEGNYVGGLVGRAKGPIVSGYSKSLLSGGNYIGGIVGYGTELAKCYSISSIEEHKAHIGAIAGYMENNDGLESNYFVSDSLAAVDGVSYEKKAEPMDYEDFLKLEGLPSFYKNFDLIFMVGNDEIHRVELSYGDSLEDIKLPKIPDREGYYGNWEEIEAHNIYMDTVIEGIYHPFMSVIESQEKRRDKIPILLVEGNFIEGDELLLSFGECKLPDRLESKEPFESLSLSIPKSQDREYGIRYIAPSSKRKLSLYVEKDGRWRKEKALFDGDYLVFKTDSNEVDFCVFEGPINYRLYAILLSILIVLIFATIIFLIMRRRKRVK